MRTLAATHRPCGCEMISVELLDDFDIDQTQSSMY